MVGNDLPNRNQPESLPVINIAYLLHGEGIHPKHQQNSRRRFYVASGSVPYDGPAVVEDNI